ncbi:hypothetical protein RAS2_09290 [Phycisphaerae bacterium RAS2]|nr:hypothetical protein RAS2_09290 [Phycisphaerae bacterium RAS2]
MTKKSMCGVVVLVSIIATSAHAAIILHDNFNRSGPLHGTTPTITPGGAWTAHSGFATDGTRVNAAFSLFGFTEAAYLPLPVPITSGNVYTLSATTYRGLSTDNTAIMIFGFFDATPSWNASAAVDEGHAIAIAPRNNQHGVNNILTGFIGTDIFVADGTNGVTFGVRLYETTPNNWVAVAVELAPTNQVISSPPTPISLANIHSIGMISGSLLPPFIDNFTLDVSPAISCSCPGDMNADGFIDGRDIQQFTQCIFSGGSCICAEMDETPGLTLADVAAFVEDLLSATACP